MRKNLILVIAFSFFQITISFISAQAVMNQDKLLEIISRVNNYWQTQNSKHGRSFWDNAAYHTGNMEAYYLTGNNEYKQFSEDWAEYNNWMGATGTNKQKWKYTPYGEGKDFVLFGDWQICFQTYIDLYNISSDDKKIARAKEVMNYQISLPNNDFWWWVDGLYMVMPVMTKMYKLTGNNDYLNKLYEYWQYTNSEMYDEEECLYYRDSKYIYPEHTTLNGKKDFWARGNGWAFAALVKVLNDLPHNDEYRDEYIKKFQQMARSIKECQQEEGYWTRSMIDAEHAPGRETSGTAFFTYGLFWGINQGILDADYYLDSAMRGWQYLSAIALHNNGKIGYVQPIGEKAIPGQVVDANSTANFGVGAFLLAACEVYRYSNNTSSIGNETLNNMESIVFFDKGNNKIKIYLNEKLFGKNVSISAYDITGSILYNQKSIGQTIHFIPLKNNVGSIYILEILWQNSKSVYKVTAHR